MKKTKLMTAALAALLTLSYTGTYNLCSAEKLEISMLGIRGDVNNDGNLTALDLVRYKQHLLGKNTLLSSDYVSDVNSDGKIDICDFVTLKSALLGNTKIWSYKNMPVMDGSTSAIPLEAGFKAKMLGIPYTKAKELVSHHKTHESFQLLLSGENDMIFTVPISESQREDAKKAGVELNLAPVAKEGFVFVVNKNNPIDSLTQQQIKDIYSGKITNWSELGGNDEKIIPYQRNTDSGSQNYMVEFMKDSELMEAPKEYQLTSMGGLMDGLAVYDNAQNAIGYSVYSYAAQMYENSADVKFIAVDGVKPSRETMADNTYPLLSNTYILYTDKATQNTLDFIKWATSDEGQQCVLENGYVPVADIEYPENLKLYTSKGTGNEKPDYYIPDEKYSSYSYELHLEYEDGIRFLKNSVFQGKINNDLKKELQNFSDPTIKIEAINGYMSITIIEESPDLVAFTQNDKNSIDSVEKVATLNYDLINNKKIEKFSDLFYKDIDFISLVNDCISSEIGFIPEKFIRTDFLGLTGSVDKFTINNIFTESDNPYFTEVLKFPYIDHFLTDYMVTGKYYDMSKLLNIQGKTSDYDYDENYDKWKVINYIDENGEFRQKVDSRFYTVSQVENRNKAYEKIFNTGKTIRDRIDWASGRHLIISNDWSSKYCSTLDVLYLNLGKIDGFYGPYMFDPNTGEQIFISDIIGKEFSEYDNSDDYYISDIDLESKKARLFSMNYDEIDLDLNLDNVNMRYIHQMPHTLKLTELSQVLPGTIKFNTCGYTSSYILEYGPEEIEWSGDMPNKNDNSVITKRKCYSHGKNWYECWREEDNKYYGWISERYLNITFNPGEK